MDQFGVCSNCDPYILAGKRERTEIGSAYVRYFDMVITYFLLAAVDIRKKIVPNEILLCYLAGQMLMMAAFDTPEIWIQSWIGAIVLSVLLGILAWFSKGWDWGWGM